MKASIVSLLVVAMAFFACLPYAAKRLGVESRSQVRDLLVMPTIKTDTLDSGKMDTVDCSKTVNLTASPLLLDDMAYVERVVEEWSIGPFPKIVVLGEMNIDSTDFTAKIFAQMSQDSLSDAVAVMFYGNQPVGKGHLFRESQQLMDEIAGTWIIKQIGVVLEIEDFETVKNLLEVWTDESRAKLFKALWLLKIAPDVIKKRIRLPKTKHAPAEKFWPRRELRRKSL